MKGRKWLGGFVAALIGAGLLCLSFRKIEWQAFLETVVSCNWPLLLLSAIAGALMPMCRSLRWRQTVLPFYPEVRRLDSVLSNYVGYLVNMAVPYTHEATRCILMHRKACGKTTYDKLVGVALMEKACDAVCIFLLFIVTTVMSFDRYMPFLKSRFYSGNTLCTMLIIAMICIVVTIAVLIVKRFRNSNRICEKVYGFFLGMKEGLLSITRLKRPWIYICETVLLWFIYWLQLYLGTKAMPSLNQVGISDCVFLTFAVAIASVVPTPGGFGAFHFMVASSLSTLCSIPWNDSLAYATVVHESQALLLILFGAVSSVIGTPASHSRGCQSQSIPPAPKGGDASHSRGCH